MGGDTTNENVYAYTPRHFSSSRSSDSLRKKARGLNLPYTKSILLYRVTSSAQYWIFACNLSFENGQNSHFFSDFTRTNRARNLPHEETSNSVILSPILTLTNFSCLLLPSVRVMSLYQAFSSLPPVAFPIDGPRNIDRLNLRPSRLINIQEHDGYQYPCPSKCEIPNACSVAARPHLPPIFRGGVGTFSSWG